MKKAVKLLSIAVLLIVSVFTFSCSAGLDALQYIEEYDNIIYDYAKSVTLPDGSITEKVGGLVEFQNSTGSNVKYSVYSLDKRNTIFNYTKFDSSENVDINLYALKRNSAGYFTVTIRDTSNDTVSTELYDSNGFSIAKCQKNAKAVNVLNKYVVFNNAAYSIANTFNVNSPVLEKAFDLDEFNNLSSADHVSDDYLYYVTTSSETGGGISVTDKKGKYVSAYNFKNWFNEREYFFLQDGKVVIQYLEALPSDERSYDILSEGIKYNLQTEIFNPKNGSVSKKNVKFIIVGLDPLEEEDSKFNFAEIARIENKRVNTNSELVILKNNLSIKESFNDVVNCCKSIVKPNSNYYLAEDCFGQTHVINNQGETIKTIGSSSFNYNKRYIWTEKTVYDYNFNKLIDLEENQYRVEYALRNCLILSENSSSGNKYYLYTNNSLTELASNYGESFHSYIARLNIYCINNGDGYSFYNETGTLLFTSSSNSYNIITASDDSVLFSVGESCYIIS